MTIKARNLFEWLGAKHQVEKTQDLLDDLPASRQPLSH